MLQRVEQTIVNTQNGCANKSLFDIIMISLAIFLVTQLMTKANGKKYVKHFFESCKSEKILINQ